MIIMKNYYKNQSIIVIMIRHLSLSICSNASLWAFNFKLAKWNILSFNLSTLSLSAFLFIQTPATLYKIIKYSYSIHTPITFLYLTLVNLILLVFENLVLRMHLLNRRFFIFNCLISKVCIFNSTLFLIGWYL
jgi:hypothetical protein